MTSNDILFVSSEGGSVQMLVQIIFSTDATVRTVHEVSYDTKEHDKTSPGLFIHFDVYNGVFS